MSSVGGTGEIKAFKIIKLHPRKAICNLIKEGI